MPTTIRSMPSGKGGTSGVSSTRWRAGDRDRRVAAGQRGLGGRHLGGLASEEAHASTVARALVRQTPVRPTRAPARDPPRASSGPRARPRAGAARSGSGRPPSGDATRASCASPPRLVAFSIERTARSTRAAASPSATSNEIEEREARVAHGLDRRMVARAARRGAAPPPPGARGERRGSRARGGRARPCRRARRSRRAGASVEPVAQLGVARDGDTGEHVVVPARGSSSRSGARRRSRARAAAAGAARRPSRRRRPARGGRRQPRGRASSAGGSRAPRRGSGRRRRAAARSGRTRRR